MKSWIEVSVVVAEAITAFGNRSWSHRLWVRQEIWLANEDAVVLCVTRSLPWREMRMAFTAILLKGLRVNFDEETELPRYNTVTSAFLRMILSVQSICGRTGKPNEKFEIVAWRLQSTVCTDTRDRIFAMLSFCITRSFQ